MTFLQGWAAYASNQALETIVLRLGQLEADEVEIAVEHCGICHSDISVLNNAWGFTRYPLIPGHEVIGKISALGDRVKHLSIDQRVGVGWHSRSCMTCEFCINAQQHLCRQIAPTIIGRPGGFADKMRVHGSWAFPIPEGIDVSSAAPLFCAGISVFQPFEKFAITPAQHVGILGIGGLGHLGVKFAKAWGCEITALTSSEDKKVAALKLGAHRSINYNDSSKMQHMQNSIDLLLVTSVGKIPWDYLISMLKPGGRLHLLGFSADPLTFSGMPLIIGEKQISGSAAGNIGSFKRMLEFSHRHKIFPEVEHFRMSDVNQAIKKLVSGQARFRIVLDADFNT